MEERIDLPPMPEAGWRQVREAITPRPALEWFSPDQMQAFARAAVLLERERAARIVNLHFAANNIPLLNEIVVAIRAG
jgi:hypothetical protein